LTRESLFEILARSETRFLDPKFSQDFRETRESKLVARLGSLESHRQKFRSENREKRVLLRNFVARIASYESRTKNFRSKTRFSRVSQTNFVARLASLANRNFAARLARIIINFNSGVLRESCKNFESNTNFSLLIMTLLVCESRKCKTHKLHTRKLDNISHFSLLARLVRLARLALIFSARSESHFSQNSREKNCETRLAVNPRPRASPKTLNKKTVQHNVDDDILTQQCFLRAHR
jgi:hypothetical protein